MYVDRISLILWLFVALSARLASSASVISTVTTSPLQHPPSSIRAWSTVVKTSTSSSQTQKYVLPSCLEDVFAEIGIRWYLNGPLLPGVTYWQDPPKDYSTGRAAQRLIRLGYRCARVQLYDSSDPYY
ncbi:hypothetical protein GQ600_16607 [Phytophthora cactorum]|nr:hypothetical protein GQ600_16607 [Phytophthora cactorum]